MSTAGTLYEVMQRAGARQGGVLQLVNANTLSYLPYNGNQIKINGIWRTIPATGIVGLTRTGAFVGGVAGQTLANNTVYNVFAFMNSSVMTADFVLNTVGHSTSLTAGNVGTEIKTGDDTRTLIGKVCIYSNTFVDDYTMRYVRSWVNRKVPRLDMYNIYTSQIVIATGTPTVSAPTINFLSWANETVTVNFSCMVWNDLAYGAYCRINWTGTSGLLASMNVASSSVTQWRNYGMSESRGDLAESANYACVWWWTAGGTAHCGSSLGSLISGCIDG